MRVDDSCFRSRYPWIYDRWPKSTEFSVVTCGCVRSRRRLITRPSQPAGQRSGIRHAGARPRWSPVREDEPVGLLHRVHLQPRRLRRRRLRGSAAQLPLTSNSKPWNGHTRFAGAHAGRPTPGRGATQGADRTHPPRTPRRRHRARPRSPAPSRSSRSVCSAGSCSLGAIRYHPSGNGYSAWLPPAVPYQLPLLLHADRKAFHLQCTCQRQTPSRCPTPCSAIRSPRRPQARRRTVDPSVRRVTAGTPTTPAVADDCGSFDAYILPR